MSAKKFVALTVDAENNAEQWWDAVREVAPHIASALERDGRAVVSNDVFDALASLPGYSDGPEHAETALIDCGGAGDRWCAVVAGRHQVFEILR